MDITQAFFPLDGISAAGQWLNETFAEFDYKILEFYHNLAIGPAGEFLNKFVEMFTHLGDGGYLLIAIGLILMLFKKTRKIGCTVLGSIGIGALLVNICLKNVIARPRPYVTTQTYWDWWQTVGHGLEREYSFPSGHANSLAAGASALFLWCDKKKIWPVFLFVIAIGASRNYIMVHYPTDVLAGFIVGTFAGVCAFLLVKYLYEPVCKNFGKLGQFMLNWDVRDLKKKKS